MSESSVESSTTITTNSTSITITGPSIPHTETIPESSSFARKMSHHRPCVSDSLALSNEVAIVGGGGQEITLTLQQQQQQQQKLKTKDEDIHSSCSSDQDTSNPRFAPPQRTVSTPRINKSKEQVLRNGSRILRRSLSSDSLITIVDRRTSTKYSPEEHEFDRYGFLVTSTNRTAADDLINPERVRKENQRLIKWEKMLQDFDYCQSKRPDQVRERARKGIPDAVRGRAWRQLAGNLNISQEHDVNILSEKIISEKDRHQISIDLGRTLPTNEFFSHLNKETGELYPNLEGHEKLRKMLHSYSVYDPEVSYCQGMNFVAAVPLFYMPLQEAFDTLLFLMQSLNYREYFLKGFPRLHKSISILEHLINHELPRLGKHFQKEQIIIQLFVTQWFLTLFTYNLPFPAIIRLWDWIFVEGHDVVFAVALAILKMVQDEMLSKEGEELLEFTMSFSEQLNFTPDQLIREALAFKHVIKSVKKLQIKNPSLSSSTEIDIYGRKQRYDKALPFYFRNTKSKGNI